MSNLKKVKRFSAGNTRVTADVTGAGEWLTGTITEVDRKNATFQPDDGSEPVTLARSEFFKPEEEAKPVAAPEDEVNEDDVVDASDLDVEDGEEEDEDPDAVRIKPQHDRYTSFGDQPTKSGRASYDTDDFVAASLRGMKLNDVFAMAYKVLKQCEIEHVGRGAKKMKVTQKGLKERYSNLKNDGMKRMVLGNLIRGTYRQLGVDPEEEMADLLK